MNIKKFKHYLDHFNLGEITFPTDITIKLKNLYKGLNAYVDNFYDIEAIIIFGSSVKFPGYNITERKVKRHFWTNELITKKEKEKIEPNDVDFLIITKKPYFEGKYIKAEIERYSDGSCYWTSIVSGKIDLINRSISQIKEGIKNNDTISISALEKGVILVDNGILNQFKVVNKNKYKVYIEDDDLQFDIKIKE